MNGAGAVNGPNGGFTVSGGNSYDAAASFPVSVTVTDADGASVVLSGTATVADAPITGSVMYLGATQGVPVLGVPLATFTDPYAYGAASDYAATIDWGDGTTSAGVVQGSDGAYGVRGSHTYAGAVSYTLQVTLADAGGGATASGTAQVALTPNYVVGNLFNSGGGSPSQYTATIDWGDGTAPTAGVVTDTGGGNYTISAPHVYLEEGDYTVSVSVTQTGGGAATFYATAFVAAAPLMAAAPPGQVVAVPVPSVQSEVFYGTGIEQVTSDDGKTVDGSDWQVAAARNPDLVFVDGTSMALTDLRFAMAWTRLAPPLAASLTAVGTVTGVGIPKGMTITAPLEGDGPDGLQLAGEAVVANMPFDHVTEGWMAIHWDIVLGNGWQIDAGTATNWLYVPFQAEYVAVGFPPKPLYETVLKTGCVYNGGAADTDDSVLAHAFAPFRALQVLRAGYAPTDPNAYLTYYGKYATPNITTAALLGNNDGGNCIAWSKFLVDVLEAQGIHQTDWFYPVYATTTLTGVVNGFSVKFNLPTAILVKQWNWTAPQPTFVMPQDPNLGNLQGQKFFLDTGPAATPANPSPILGPNSYKWTTAQVVQAQNDPLNFPGQGVRNPQSMFNMHNVVEIDGELYDPSYGRVWADLNSFRANALAGFAYVFPNMPLDANNQYDPKGTPQYVVAIYPPGTAQPAITLSIPTPGDPAAASNNY